MQSNHPNTAIRWASTQTPNPRWHFRSRALPGFYTNHACMEKRQRIRMCAIQRGMNARWTHHRAAVAEAEHRNGAPVVGEHGHPCSDGPIKSWHGRKVGSDESCEDNGAIAGALHRPQCLPSLDDPHLHRHLNVCILTRAHKSLLGRNVPTTLSF